MKRACFAAWSVSVMTAVGAAAPEVPTAELQLLLCSLFRCQIAEQTARQAAQIAAQSGAMAAAEVAAAADRWRHRVLDSIRRELEAAIGESARQSFSEFVSAYTTAESAQDTAFLAGLARTLQWAPAPADYEAFRAELIARHLAKDLASAAQFLGELQTWIDLQRRSRDVPPLTLWLERTSVANSGVAVASTRPPQRTFKPSNPLRDAEVPTGEFVGIEEPAASGLEALRGSRAARREKAREVAEAGMQQVAEERRSEEEGLAAKKTTAAQAEAEALKRHAEKLAAAEQEAIEQRKHSWAGRLKQIISTTMGAAGGAFFGSVGNRAGEAAAEAVFQ